MNKSNNLYKVIAVVILLTILVALYYLYNPNIKKLGVMQNANIKGVGEKENNLVSLARNLTKIYDNEESETNKSETHKDMVKDRIIDSNIALLEYIDKNIDDTKNYIISNEQATNTSEWEIVTSVYILSEAYKADKLANINSYSERVYKDLGEFIKDRTDIYRVDNLNLGGLYFYFYKRPNANYIVQVNNLLDSGAYNISSYFYNLEIDKNKNTLSVNEIKVIDYNKDKLVQGDSGDVNNYNYRPETDEVVSYGMKPFGIYPCNERWHYEILDDRMILRSKSIPTACVGLNIDEPNDLDKYLDEDADFSKETVLSTIPDKLYKEAQTFVFR